ncbi:hypothetical protein BH23CHL3_BH23CHL3_03780 [soil metagenome]
MEKNETVVVRVARILAISGVAAGVAGGLVGRIVAGKRSGDPRVETLKSRSTEGTHEARKLLRAVADSDTGKAMRQSFDWVSNASGNDLEKLKMKAPKRKDANELADRLLASISVGSEKAAHTASGAMHEAADFLSQTSKDSRGVAERVRETWDHQAPEIADQAKRLRKQSGEHLADAEKYVVEALDDRVKPSLAKAGKSASHVADEWRSRLADQLDHLGDVADDRRPQLASAADQASKRISHLLKDVDAASDDWLVTAERALHDAEELLQDNTRAAKEFAGDVGDSARQGGKDFGSLVFWVMIAGGLIYAFLLDDEQKRKSRELAKSAYAEGKELYRDVQGRDAEFSAQ